MCCRPQGVFAIYATSAGVSASYSYDAAGQRTRSVVTSGSVTTTTTYTYEGLNLLSLAATQSTGATYSVSYLYDAQARPYAGVYASQGATPTVFQVVTTDRGDVVELLDSAGTAFAAYRYDAWGVPTETTSTATGTITSAVAAAIASRQPLRYAGYAYDEHSGLYYLSARSYDPVTRQFLSKDPAKDDGEESAYQYCGGDPVGKVDPTGLHTSKVGRHYHPGSGIWKMQSWYSPRTFIRCVWRGGWTTRNGKRVRLHEHAFRRYFGTSRNFAAAIGALLSARFKWVTGFADFEQRGAVRTDYGDHIYRAVYYHTYTYERY